MTAVAPSVERIDQVLDDVYAWSRARDYLGYNKHDGLNSPILRALLGWGRWPRMTAIQGVMRFPVNVRPLLMVRPTANPKGLALFARGLLDRHRATGTPEHLSEARQLLTRLRSLASPGEWGGSCWGYPYPWQDPGFYAPTGTPNAVVTSFVCNAFLDAWEVTGDASYLDTVERAIPFFLRKLTVLKDTPDELCLGYMPMPMTMRVMDVSILIGSVLARHAAASGMRDHMETARRLIRYVVRRQTAEGAWFYTDPPGDSRIRHDNYHTGFILDALEDSMEATGEREWAPSLERGLAFYATRLFNADGSPRWMSDRDFPHDIHGAAQGILTFSRHRGEYPGLAERIAGWALDRMYRPEGRFLYQETRFFRKRFTLTRWCNAWMARGLAALRKALW
jgi:uncharacterized protein YyaL (SSP411 family)